jgi:hypothetical protein
MSVSLPTSEVFMRNFSPATIGVFLSATLAATALADGTWEILTLADGISPANINGIADAVIVPNTFNNPTVDDNGRVRFRCQIAGPGITNTGAAANHLVVLAGSGGAWDLVIRNNSGVPGDLPSGAIFSRTASPNNSIVSANNSSADGGFLASGFMTGPGITTGTNDTAMWFIPASGAPSLLLQGRDFCPGTAGAQFAANVSAGSGVRVNSQGQLLYYGTLTGGDTVTANNAALVLVDAGPDQLIVRKGDAAQGFKGLTLTPDSFGQFLNGSKFLFSAKLVGAGITTANDSVYCTNAFVAGGGYRILAREGDAIPGLDGLTFANTSSFGFGQRPLGTDGSIVFSATLGGAVTTVDNAAIIKESNGTFEILIRKGDAFPGITDSSNPDFAGKVFSTVNSSGNVRARNGLYAFEGILMNADGTAITSPAPATFVGARKADGTKFTICRQSDPVPGVAGSVFASVNGSTSICVDDYGNVVFKANYADAAAGTSGTGLFAWDEVGGLRLLAKTGDTTFTGTPCNQITLIGGTGNNGDGGGTGISATGWLAVSASDTVSGLYAVARIRIGSTSNPCPEDVNGSGAVDAADLAALLAGWGTASPDPNGDGNVDAADLAVLLAAWGPCQ